MSPSHRVLPCVPPLGAAALVAVVLAACSGASPPEPLACTERSQCAADAFCRAGSCVRSAPPVARIAALATDAPRVNRVLAFDASASADPDAEDRVVAFAWRTQRVSAACDPSVVEANAAAYRVLFPCTGEFRVEVAVTDSTGVESAPAALVLNVAADEVAAPVVRTGAALTLDHRCEGTPLVCTPLGEAGATSFALSSIAAGGRGELAQRWTATQPDGSPAPPSLTFSDRAAAAPTVALRTSGPISGTWTFRIVATDADGRSAVGEQKVTIANRAPVLSQPLGEVAVHHVHDPADGSYRAEGSVAAAFVDPDGDPVSVRFTAEATGDGGHGISIEPDGSFAIRIPSSEPQHLIGDEVTRRAVVEADDGNGAPVRLAVPILVQNRAPRIAVARSLATVPHTYDAVRRVYTASTTLSDYVDDDGDPILPGSVFELIPAGCSAIALSGPTLGLTCEVPLSTVAALSTLVRSHVLDVTVQDPWAHSVRATAKLEVTNQPPRFTGSGAALNSSYTQGACCWWDDYEDECGAWPRLYQDGNGSFSGVGDPDGDPLDVTYENTSPELVLSRRSASGCRGVECAVGLHLTGGGNVQQCVPMPDPGNLRVTITDGVLTAQATLPVWR
ncbi:MAG TPA: hypothetical protein VFK85_02965 [Anaeromyxobacteraceae bacterium]|nr:hypothetical protein [Anaeromyxobacteraceae bacterium]